MEEYLPRLLNLSWQERLYVRNYQSIHSSMLSCHTQAILSLCQRSSLSNYSALENEKFWKTLKIKSDFSDPVLQLHERWKNILPLAHLNTKQLIRLLQNEINPLVEAYKHILIELEEESFLEAVKRKVAKQTQKNLERVEKLKNLIYAGLAERAKVYRTLKSARQVDDIAAAFAKEINALNLLKEPFKIVIPFSEGLDDNQRITTYDILRKLDTKNKNKAALDEIILPIPKHEVIPLRKKSEIKEDEERLNLFIEKQRIKNKENDWESWMEILPGSVKLYINLAWQGRYFLYALILTMMIQSGLSLLSSLGLSAGYLAYTIVLPWVYVFWKELKGRFFHWKNQEIMESLSVLKQSQRFIDCHLSQSPLDLAHFDFDYFFESVKQVKSQLNNHLGEVGYFERWLLPETLIKQAKKIASRLHDQQENVDRWLNVIAVHIADRIGDSIEREELAPVSLEKWRQYVKHYGDAEAKLIFEKNANIIARWINKIPSFLIRKRKDPEDLLSFPWKGYCLRNDSLKKWTNLIKVWVQDQKKREACLDLHLLLKNKKMLSKEAFQKTMKILAIDPSKIQIFLYQTLSDRGAQTARLLTDKQQDAIRDWRNEHFSAIREAHKIMDSVLDRRGNRDYSDHQLQQCYLLLDAEDFYDAVQGNMENKEQRKNRVRQFFEEYQGQSSRVFQLLRFIPSRERSKWSNEIANRRLTWLLQHGGVPNRLTDEDTIIFKNSWIEPLRRKQIEALLNGGPKGGANGRSKKRIKHSV